jgi:hypothetical protein
MPAPAAQGRGIGHRQSHPAKRQNRTHETRGLPQRLAINLLQEQRQPDDRIWIYERTPSFRHPSIARCPRGGKIVSQPQGQAAAIGQLPIISLPVYFLFEKAHEGYTFI